MTDSPRYFQPLEVPHYCYLWEAIMWVGFGRFPEGSYLVTDGYPEEADYGYKVGTMSFNWKDALFRQEYRFNGFGGSEAGAIGLTEQSTDWAKYDEILRYHGYIRQALLTAEIARLQAFPPRVDDGLQVLALETAITDTLDRFDGGQRTNYLENLEKRLAQTPFVDSVHGLFQHQVDRAWVKLFLSLTDGPMQSFGWRELSQDEIREMAGSGQGIWQDVVNPYGLPMPSADLNGPLHTMATLDVIPVREWSLTGFAPDAHYQSATGTFWWDELLPVLRTPS